MKVVKVLVVAVVLTAMGSTAVLGASLTSIGVLDPSAPYSLVQAVSADGSYAVGTSKAVGGIQVPIVWSASDGLVALPNPSGQNSLAHGVAVGIGSNAGNIIISGLHENNTTHRFYKAPLTNLAGGAWIDTATAGELGSAGNMRGGTSNDLRIQPGSDGRWYTAGRRNDTGRNARYRGDPSSGWDGTAVRSVGSVSAYGVNVGRDNASPSNAFYEGPAVSFGTVPGSTGSRADGIGISSGFGKSSTSDFDVQWICGQVQNYNGPGTTFQAFRWKRGDASMTFLGSLAPAGGGDTGNNSSCAYTVADNGVTAGHSYFGAVGTIPGYYVATVWDTSGTWDTTGAPKSVKALLDAAGVDTSMWSSLTRVYAASDDGKVLAGYGVWAADGSTRGFVAVIPEPATLALLTLTLPLLRRRR
ncbi:MAG TPA: hypothetical protein PLL20_12060 [Phycisphaerae bacterium]|nr:hypothetical protein [Phycisphaerae bacterium]HRR84050.1 hypothetical protein [Phycisphaerae bacterium]